MMQARYGAATECLNPGTVVNVRGSLARVTSSMTTGIFTFVLNVMLTFRGAMKADISDDSPALLVTVT